MVGNAVLREIVGADLLGAVATPDLAFALAGILGGFFFFFQLRKFGSQNLESLFPVCQLTSFVGGAHVNAGRLVDETHSSLYFVYILAAFAAGARIFHLDFRHV